MIPVIVDETDRVVREMENRQRRLAVVVFGRISLGGRNIFALQFDRRVLGQPFDFVIEPFCIAKTHGDENDLSDKGRSGEICAPQLDDFTDFHIEMLVVGAVVIGRRRENLDDFAFDARERRAKGVFEAMMRENLGGAIMRQASWIRMKMVAMLGHGNSLGFMF